MNIINKIDEYIFNNPKDVLHIRDDHKACIKDFLGKPNKTTAKKLFKFVGEIQKNNKIYDRLSELVKYEESLAAIIPEQKDHYFHSASVYVLGLALYNKMPSLRKAIKVERLNGCENEEYKQKTSFLWSWSVAACLHDIGYPFELAIKSFNKLTDQYYTKERKYLKIDKAIINDKLILTPFGDNMKYYEFDTVFKIIASRLIKDGHYILSLETMANYIERYYRESLKNGKIDHGLISSLILIRDLYDNYINKKYNPDMFYQDMANAVTAIFLHNFYRYSIIKEFCGASCFKLEYPNSLGCLLFVCDTICEWFRKNNKNFDDFDMHNDNDINTFYISKKHEEDIKSSIEIFDKEYFRVEYFEPKKNDT